MRPIGKRGLHRILGWAELFADLDDAAIQQLEPLGRQRAIKLVGGVGEFVDAVFDEIGRDLVEVDAARRQCLQNLVRVVDAVLDRRFRRAVIAERVHGLRRHGVDGVRPDQCVDIEHVGIGLVLGAGGGPEQALRPRPARRQFLPTRTGEDLFVDLIGGLGIGDGDLAAQGCQRRQLAALVLAGGFELGVDQRIDLGIDAADEEARHAGHARKIGIGRHLFEALDIGLGNLPVDVAGKQQCDVNVDAMSGQVADCGQSGLRCRHLYHQVRPVDFRP